MVDATHGSSARKNHLSPEITDSPSGSSQSQSGTLKDAPEPVGDVPSQDPSSVAAPTTGFFVVSDLGGDGDSIFEYRTLPPPSERQFVGRFRLVRRLASGSFGEVFLAHDPVLQRDVAIKLPRWTTVTSDEMRTRFLREGQAASKVHHPHVVHVLEAGVVNDQLYIASEYCEGPDLAEWLKDRGNVPCDPRWSALLIAQLADGVEQVHRADIVHRDIKPRNIMLQVAPGETGNGKWTPKLTDFGVAKFLDVEGDQTQTGAFLGTLKYMAPEQASGRSYEADSRTDVYALGVVLYELLTGVLPSVGANDADTLRLICQCPPRPPRAYQRVIPRDLQAICFKCLEKEPERRYQSAAELHEDLERFLEGRPTEARPLTTYERLVRWSRSHPASAALVLVTMFAVVGALLGFFVHHRRLDGALAAAQVQRQRAEQSEQLTKDLLYAADMRLALQLWERRELTSVWDQLARQQPAIGETDRRGFEWYWLNAVSHLKTVAISGHVGPIYSSASTHDGSRLVTVGKDGIVRVWHARGQHLLYELPGHHTEINDLAIHPSEQQVATVDDHGEVFLWDLNNGSLLATFDVSDHPLYGVAFSSDGQFLVLGDKAGQMYVFQGREEVRRFAVATVALDHLVFLPDSSRIAAAVGPNVEIWDTRTAQKERVLEGPGSSVTKVAISPDAQWLAAGSVDRNIYMWSLETGHEMAVLKGHFNWVQDVEFSRDGKSLTSCGKDGTIREWPLDVLAERRLYQAGGSFADPTDSVAPGDLRAGTAHSVASQVIGVHKDRAWSVSYVGDGDHLASTDHLGVTRFWTRKKNNPVVFEPADERIVFELCWGDDSNQLFSADDSGTVSQWQLATGTISDILHPASTPLRALATHSPSGTIVAGDNEGTVIVWDRHSASTPQRIPAFRKGPIKSVAISPSGHLIAACNEYGEVVAWDLTESRETARRLPVNADLRLVHFLPDGKTLMAAGGSHILLLQVPSLQLIREIKCDHQVIQTKWIPSAGTLVSGHGDCNLRLWDRATGRQLGQLRGHHREVYSIAVSPDQRTLASSAADGEVRLWHIPSRQPMGRLSPPSAGAYHGLCFSPDGTKLAGIYRNGAHCEIHIWSAARHAHGS